MARTHCGGRASISPICIGRRAQCDYLGSRGESLIIAIKRLSSRPDGVATGTLCFSVIGRGEHRDAMARQESSWIILVRRQATDAASQIISFANERSCAKVWRRLLRGRLIGP